MRSYDSSKQGFFSRGNSAPSANRARGASAHRRAATDQHRDPRASYAHSSNTGSLHGDDRAYRDAHPGDCRAVGL